MHARLAKIRAQFEKGNTPNSVTVRKFLQWFDAKRRGTAIVAQIRESLEEANLDTFPDFEIQYIDGEIEFIDLLQQNEIQIGDFSEKGAIDTEENAAQTESDTDKILVEKGTDDFVVEENFLTASNKDPTYRISKLKAANQKIVSVTPDALLVEVISVMLTKDFSQIPVMTNERSVKGMITWKNIGAKIFITRRNIDQLRASDVMERPVIIQIDRSLFDAISIIVEHDYVLTERQDRSISGIITPTDLSLQFQELTEPFLLLSEIENSLRVLMSDKFSINDFKQIVEISGGSREIKRIDDLNFGEYILLLQNPAMWEKFKVSVDRAVFCDRLNEVRIIRNDVMHFDPDGIDPEQLAQLRTFGQFLKKLQSLVTS